MSRPPHFPMQLRSVPGRSGWYRTRRGDCEELESRVLAFQDSEQLDKWQVVCGLLDDENAHRIFFIDGVHPVELARQFRTGSHNAWDTEQVCEDLTRIYEVAPFRPYFVDPAGYKCQFVPAVSRQQADAIEKMITVGVEGYASEDVDNVADAILAENSLRLWWD